MSSRDFAVRWLSVWMLTFCIAAHSESKDYEGERTRIEAQRQQQSRELDALEQACHTRFAVTDCVNRVRSLRRQRLAVLDQRIAQINSEQRLEQAEQSRQIRKKKLVELQRRDAERSATAVSAAAQSPTNAREAGLPSVERRGQDRAAKPDNTADAATRAARQARFLRKQQEAQERRQLRDQRLKDPVPPHLALPLPP